MLKLNLLKALGWAALGAAFTNTASAQVKTLSATPKPLVSPVLLSGDSLDEASLLRSLGITEFEAELEDQLELATLDMEQFASSSFDVVWIDDHLRCGHHRPTGCSLPDSYPKSDRSLVAIGKH